MKAAKTKKPIHKKGILSEDDVNAMLDIFQEFDIIYKKKGTITEEMTKYAKEYGCEGLLDDLMGYEVTIRVNGDHRHDSQMVDYTFTLTSPKGNKTVFGTEMCLQAGWNFDGELKYK